MFSKKDKFGFSRTRVKNCRSMEKSNQFAQEPIIRYLVSNILLSMTEIKYNFPKQFCCVSLLQFCKLHYVHVGQGWKILKISTRPTPPYDILCIGKFNNLRWKQ